MEEFKKVAEEWAESKFDEPHLQKTIDDIFEKSFNQMLSRGKSVMKFKKGDMELLDDEDLEEFLKSNYYETVTTMNPQQILERYGEVLTDEQIQYLKGYENRD